MGSYIYRVTAEQVMCSDDKPANVTVYAYKPYGWGSDRDKLNAQMHFKSGCVASERLAELDKLTDRIVIAYGDDKDARIIPAGAHPISNPLKHATYWDDAVGSPNGTMHQIRDVIVMPDADVLCMKYAGGVTLRELVQKQADHGYVPTIRLDVGNKRERYERRALADAYNDLAWKTGRLSKCYN